MSEQDDGGPAPQTDTIICTDDVTGEIVGCMVDATDAFLEEEAAPQPAAPKGMTHGEVNALSFLAVAEAAAAVDAWAEAAGDIVMPAELSLPPVFLQLRAALSSLLAAADGGKDG